MEQVGFVMEGPDGGWTLFDQEGNALNPDHVVFNRETGEFEAPLLEGAERGWEDEEETDAREKGLG